MCELETTVIPKLKDNIKLWTRYVDDTFAFVKATEVENIHRTLNAYEPKIQFTYEMENERKLSFLDVTIEREKTPSLKPAYTESEPTTTYT